MAIGNRDLMQGQLPYWLYTAHENRKMVGRVREKHQKIRGEENLERMIDVTNTMKDMSKRFN